MIGLHSIIPEFTLPRLTSEQVLAIRNYKDFFMDGWVKLLVDKQNLVLDIGWIRENEAGIELNGWWGSEGTFNWTRIDREGQLPPPVFSWDWVKETVYV